MKHLAGRIIEFAIDLFNLIRRRNGEQSGGFLGYRIENRTCHRVTPSPIGLGIVHCDQAKELWIFSRKESYE